MKRLADGNWFLMCWFFFFLSFNWYNSPCFVSGIHLKFTWDEAFYLSMAANKSRAESFNLSMSWYSS